MGHSLEAAVLRIAESDFPSRYGSFRLLAYEESGSGDVHLALVKGRLEELGERDVLVRLHSQCLTGDALGSLRCDCGEQKDRALRRIEAEGHGVFLYLRQEGRGIGLGPKIRAYQLQDRGHDTVEANELLGFPADARRYRVAGQILQDLGVRRLRLLSNNPDKLSALLGNGLVVVAREPLEIPPNPHSLRYLEVKRSKLGHHILTGNGGE